MAICVTGGSNGLGRAIAERFAASGADVLINYHADDGAAREAAAAVEARGGVAHLVKADVGTPEGVRELMEAVRARVDRLDQIVHCAAKTVTGPLLEAEPDELAAEVAPRGIRVLTVSPGAVDTTAFRSMFPETWEQRLEAAAQANPSGRGVLVDDAAALIEALARPELAMVQGQTVTVDGGLSL